MTSKENVLEAFNSRHSESVRKFGPIGEALSKIYPTSSSDESGYQIFSYLWSRYPDPAFSLQLESFSSGDQAMENVWLDISYLRKRLPDEMAIYHINEINGYVLWERLESGTKVQVHDLLGRGEQLNRIKDIVSDDVYHLALLGNQVTVEGNDWKSSMSGQAKQIFYFAIERWGKVVKDSEINVLFYGDEFDSLNFGGSPSASIRKFLRDQGDQFSFERIRGVGFELVRNK